MSTLKGYLDKTVNFFANFEQNVLNITTTTMTWTYETITKVVLHTPSFIFEGDWLRDNVVTFTGLALVVTVCLALYEGFQRMVGQTRGLTDMKKFYSKLPIALGVSAFAPTAFYFGFKGLNWVTAKIIEYTGMQIHNGVATISHGGINMLDYILLGVFNISLVGMMIPIFIQNFRRWFELILLCIVTPVAFTCWAFESRKRYFDMWWDGIKKRSTIQIVYAIYLMVIGTLMFGTPAPEGGFGVLLKCGVMIGGLFSMVRLPGFVESHLNYRGDTREVLNAMKDVADTQKSAVEGANKGYRFLRLKYLKGKRKLRAPK